MRRRRVEVTLRTLATNLITCLVLVLSGALAHADRVSSKTLQENLKKIDASIAVTKKRLNAQKETQFAPDLYFMLAELLHEKSSTSAALKSEKSPGAPPGELDFTREKQLSQDAIEAYKIIEDRFPKYSSMDRVLYTIGLESKGQLDEKGAIAYFKKVTEKFPNSPFAVKSMIEIGDLYFAKKDFEFALQHYSNAVSKASEPEKSSAQNKRGWCFIQLEKWTESLKAFEDVKSDENLEEALVASVWPLLELTPLEISAQPKYQKPVTYFKERAGNKFRFRRVLARLAQRLTFKKRTAEAAQVSYELFRIATDLKEKKAAFESAYNQMKGLKSTDFPAYVPFELRDMIVEMQHAGAVDPAMAADVKKYEPVFRDLVTSMNKKVIALARKQDFLEVSRAYEYYLSIYPTSKSASLMKLNQAEALFRAGEYADAGQAYFEVTRFTKNGSRKNKEILESSLESFLKALTETEAEIKSSLLAAVQARDGYREVAAIYSNNFKNNPKMPGVKFNAAKTYYDERLFDVAATELFNFLRSYPSSTEAKQAALLYLDCFYLRDQMKEMALAGKKVLGLPGLSSEARAIVTKASSEAAMKSVRASAGDYGTKDYALKFREFAKKNKNSALGEQALYEAFVSMKSQNQPQAFEVGEEYVSTYPNQPRSKEILLSLTQHALVLLDYGRAASYMGTYAQRYPQDANARALALQAAQIYEFLGDVDQSNSAYKIAGDPGASLRVLFRYGSWNTLTKESSGVATLAGEYYQGIALSRLGKTPQAVELLKRVSERSGGSPEEKEMTAHAAVVVAEAELAKFSSEAAPAFSPAYLQAKSGEYQAIAARLQTAVQSGGGRWVIGALFNLGRLNLAFAQVLKTAKPPAGMKADQLLKMVQPQIKGYQDSAVENFTQCLKVAEENEVVTGYVQACRERKTVRESAEFVPWQKGAKGPLSAGRLADALNKNPRDTNVLRQFAMQEIQAGRPSRALLILSRAVELAPNEAQTDSLFGVAYLGMKQYALAQSAFQAALAKDAKEPLANRGMAGLSSAYGFSRKAQSYRSKSGSGRIEGSNLHPWLK